LQRRTFYVHYLTDETVADAYSDWPDLKTADENEAFWSQALADRQAACSAERAQTPGFRVTREGIALAQHAPVAA